MGENADLMSKLRQPDKNFCFGPGRSSRPVITDHQDFESFISFVNLHRGKILEM